MLQNTGFKVFMLLSYCVGVSDRLQTLEDLGGWGLGSLSSPPLGADFFDK